MGVACIEQWNALEVEGQTVLAGPPRAQACAALPDRARCAAAIGCAGVLIQIFIFTFATAEHVGVDDVRDWVKLLQ